VLLHAAGAASLDTGTGQHQFYLSTGIILGKRAIDVWLMMPVPLCSCCSCLLGAGLCDPTCGFVESFACPCWHQPPHLCFSHKATKAVNLHGAQAWTLHGLCPPYSMCLLSRRRQAPWGTRRCRISLRCTSRGGGRRSRQPAATASSPTAKSASRQTAMTRRRQRACRLQPPLSRSHPRLAAVSASA